MSDPTEDPREVFKNDLLRYAPMNVWARKNINPQAEVVGFRIHLDVYSDYGEMGRVDGETPELNVDYLIDGQAKGFDTYRCVPEAHRHTVEGEEALDAADALIEAILDAVSDRRK